MFVLAARGQMRKQNRTSSLFLSLSVVKCVCRKEEDSLVFLLLCTHKYQCEKKVKSSSLLYVLYVPAFLPDWPPRCPSGWGVRLESRRSWVRILLAMGFFPGRHTSDLKIGTAVATLPGTWCYRVSAGTGQPSVSILWLVEVESLICNFHLSVAARKIVWADLSLRYTSLLLGCQATNKQFLPA